MSRNKSDEVGASGQARLAAGVFGTQSRVNGRENFCSEIVSEIQKGRAMNINWTKQLDSDIKYYVKKKHYKKVFDDLEPVLAELENGNLLGDKLEGLKLPENTVVYKVRIANTSADVGKSNGFRLLYYVAVEDEIYLLTIYSKKDDERVPDDTQILLLVKNILD